MTMFKRLVSISLALTLFILGSLSFASDELPRLNAIKNQSSISGLSSGAFMATQYHIAYSQDLVGVAAVAGGPWQCAASNPLNPNPLSTATSTCTCLKGLPCPYLGAPFPDVSKIYNLAKAAEEAGSIDKLENVLDDKIYLFSGKQDKTVLTPVVDSANDFYQTLGISDEQILYDNQVDAGHAFITNQEVDLDCPLSQTPFINDCQYRQARILLEQIYGDLDESTPYKTDNLIKFEQKPFVPEYRFNISSMNPDAYVYIPTDCQQDATECRVHVALHGCEQGIQSIKEKYVTGTGYLEVAEANQLIVLFPQVDKSSFIPYNPKGCWDFWGYTNNSWPPYTYYTKEAIQMRAIKAMLDHLTAD